MADDLARAVELTIALREELKDDPELLILVELLLLELARRIAQGP